jgi:hypothetical protein
MGFLLENLGIVMRLALIAGSLLCFTSNAINVFVGVTIGGCIFAYQMIDRKKKQGLEASI